MITKISKRGMQLLEDNLHNAIYKYASAQSDMDKADTKHHEAKQKWHKLLNDYKDAVQLPLKKELAQANESIRSLKESVAKLTPVVQGKPGKKARHA